MKNFIPASPSFTIRLCCALVAHLLLNLSIQAQFRIRQEVIKEKGFNYTVRFSPEVAKLNVSELFMSAEVISSQKVDSICTAKFSKSGYLDYTEYSISSRTYKLKRSRKKSFDEDELLLDALDQLLDSGNINLNEYNGLLEEIEFQKLSSDKEFTERKNGPVKLNVFRSDNKPLTTLEIKITNGSAKNVEFTPSAFILSNGHFLKAYTMSELISQYADTNKAIAILRGLYAETSYTIPSNSSFTFLLAFPPIESEVSTFDFHLNGAKQTFQVNRTFRFIEEKNTFYPLSLESTDVSGVNIVADKVFGICTNRNLKSWFEKNSFYADKNEMQNPIEILVLGVSNKKAYWCRYTFTPSAYFNFENLSRKILRIDPKEILFTTEE